MKIYATNILDIDDKYFNYVLSSIKNKKKDKIKKLLNKKDRVRSLVSEILIRYIICEELNISNDKILIKENPYGKPYLSNFPDFYFNISHSGDFVVCAIDSKAIGIDIEQINDINYRDIAERFFTKKELDFILDGDIRKQLNNFYEIWTFKESFIKADGRGLNIPLGFFSVDTDRLGNFKLNLSGDDTEYNLKLFEIHKDYKMAVCSLRKCISNEITLLSQDNLINNYMNLVKRVNLKDNI